MTDRVSSDCILIADDLTGACDTGVQFARYGLSSYAWSDLSRAPGWSSNVVSVNTDSRCDELARSKTKIQQVANLCVDVRPKILIKKIDSTLRGNVGQEILATMESFHRDFAIIAPAYPAMGRTVENGVLEINDGTTPRRIDIRRLLEEQGISAEYLADSPGAVDDIVASLRGVATRRKLFIADSANQADLDELVSNAHDPRHHLLWVGAAGLGLAVARHLGQPIAHRLPPPKDASVLFWIGSTCPATIEQRRFLIANSDAVEVAAEPGALETARHAINAKRHLIVSVERNSASRDGVVAFLDGLKGLPLAALVLTGGDTAAQACKALGIDPIQLMDEIAPGIPWGFLHGGSFENLPVATKAGGFGGPDALLHCAWAFAPRKAMA